MLGFYFFLIYCIGLCLITQPSRPKEEGEWWVEVVTESPRCTYYFGPFDSDKEASSNTNGYIEDLESEGAQRVSIEIKRCQPTELTICEN